MPTIQVKKATKLYRGEKRKRFEAVSEIDLEIKQGEFVFIVGSSGAGKSTLLRMITGSLRPDKGSVYLDKLNLARVPPWYLPKVRSVYGWVGQEITLMRRRTVWENLQITTFSGASLTNGEHTEKVKKALGIVGMTGKEAMYPGELSIGECRRIELARALINSPSILVLDELTANLDEDNIWDIIQLLTELNRRGTTIVMATHASQYVNILRRRVITLVDGRVKGDVMRGRYGDI